MIKNAENLKNQVYAVPPEIDAEIARLKLENMDIDIDVLTEEQIKYLNSWQEGT
jgi:adenosylhomocysteinase